MRKPAILLLCLSFICACAFGAVVSADDSITVRVGIYENYPKIFTDEKGNASGFWPDIIEYIASEEGWRIEYVPGTWAECLTRLENNEIDMMPDVAYDEARNRLYNFSKEAVYVSWSRVYTGKGSDIESILDLEGKNIAVLRGSINVEGPDGIKELVKSFNISCIFTEVDSYIKVFELVDSGEADAGVVSKDFGYLHEADSNVMRTAIIFAPSSLYFAFTKDSSLTPYLIARVDYHVKRMKENEASVYYQSLENRLGIELAVEDVDVIPGWVIWTLIGVGGLASLLAGGSCILRSRVRSKTKELTAEIDERERAEEIIKHSALELEIRNRIAEVFLTIPDEDMYSEVLSIILDTMESKHGVFGYLDEKGDLVVPTMTRTVWKKCQVPDKSILFPRETWGDTSWSHAIREKRTICLNEPSTRIPEGHIAIERHISMPLIHQGEVMGLIQVANKKTAYAPEGIALLETIGGAIAPVLDARLERERQGTARRLAEEELRKHHDHLEELVQERTRELEEAQEELVRKERLAVLGQLAGGVSHELRNPLGAIKNAAYLINMVIEHPEPEVKESLEMINREVAKSDRIITSILDYARPKPPAVQAVNVNQLLGDALSPGIVPDNIETVIRLDESLPLVMADPEQMARVFSNLILNAVQAMPEGGRLTVSSAAADDKVAVSVEDSGAGIPKENLDKIFEPLFSTRAKGIGLGLAIARDMMERNGGNIEVHSEEGKGSTFTVKLPLAGEQGRW